MIDTIILRIHDVGKHNHLLKNFEFKAKQKNKEFGVTRESFTTTNSEMGKIRRRGLNTGTQIVEALKMNRSGEYLIKTKSAKRRNESNHYDVSYFIDYVQDHIEFNFSIPKYVFGSNVLMFVDHFGDKEYNFHQCSQTDHNINRAYDLLHKFLLDFFKWEFIGNYVDYRDVEVHRIDVGFNQIFKNKRESLRYLEYQKRQRKKYARDEEGTSREYATSLMYTSKRYSAKIYHKGSEYTKHDLREHEKINKEKKRKYFKTQEYQNLADRMLRYELTIRNAMLNELHKNNLFRQKCPYFQKHLKIYREVLNTDQRNERIAKKIGTLEADKKDAYAKKHPYENVPQDLRRIHRYVQKLITRRTYFRLDIDENARLYNKETTDFQSDDALLSKNLLLLCMYKLVEFVQEYQIKELPPESQIESLIENYNFGHKKRLPKREMCAFYRDLVRVGSFKDMARYNQISRASLFRYKARFKKIGITENNLIPFTETGIPIAELDFRRYHTIMMENPHFLNKNNFLGMF